MTRILVISNSSSEFEQLNEEIERSIPLWELALCDSVEAGKQLLKSEQFDFFVSDIQPDDILHTVADNYPHMVRIVLSADQDKGKLLRFVGIAHQFLTKPCSAKDVIDCIFRAQVLRHLLRNPRLQTLLTRATQLPSLPNSYFKIVDLLSHGDYPQKALIEVLSSDMSIAAQVLKAANSAFFGQRRQISNLLDAVTILGTNAIRTIVLAAEAFSAVDRKKYKRFSLDRLWDHSLQVGSYASAISRAQKQSHELCDNALTAGVLHDIGKLVLIDNLPDDYDKVISLIAEEGMPSFEAETRVFGVSHQEVGAYLLGLWGLPDMIVETVAYHHQPLLSVPDLVGFPYDSDFSQDQFSSEFDVESRQSGFPLDSVEAYSDLDDGYQRKLSPDPEQPGASLLAFVAAANIIVRDETEDERFYADQIELEEYLSKIEAEQGLSDWRQIFE